MTITRPLISPPVAEGALQRPELAAAVGIGLSVTVGGFVWAGLLFLFFLR